MAFQHIFTSAQMGLHPGSSGYCTVAQTEGIPGDLVKALERLSTYDFSAKNDPEMGGHSPVIYRYQVVQSHSGHYFVVSRISDAGADHTGRTNYLAQHLALDSSEILQLRDYPHLNPAALLLIGLPWKDAWDEMPQTLPNLTIKGLFPGKHRVYDMRKGCSTWRKGHLGTEVDQAPMLLESPWNTKCFLHLKPGQEQELLKLLNETLWLSGEEAWRYGFTTFLQHEESHENYAWCAVSGGNAQERASGAGQMLWEIPSLPQASDEALKYKAETGHEKPIEPEPAPEPAPEPEVTQPQVPPAGPTLHTPSPDTTPQSGPLTQPTQATSQPPPTAEDFVKKMESYGSPPPPPAEAYAAQYGKKHKEYAEFIIKQIRDSDSHKFIKNYEREVHILKTNLKASVKNISAARQARQRAVLGICIQCYQPIDKIIKEKQKIIEANLKGGTQAITSDPPPPPPPANGTPENGTQRKLPWKKVIVALGLAVAVIFVLANLDWIKDKIKAGGNNQGGNNPGGNNQGGNNQGGNNQGGNNQGGNNQGGNNQGGNNQGGNNPGGNNPGGNNPGGNNPGGNNPGGNNPAATTRVATPPTPGDEYKFPPELKAKVDNYFGTGNTKVRLFVATDGLLNLKGNKVPFLFTELSKDLLNPKPTQGLRGSIDVYQHQSTNGFEGLMWKPTDASGLASTEVELLYGRRTAGNGGIAIYGVPKWNSKELAEPSEKSGVPWNTYQNKLARFLNKRFRIQVKKNTAIRVKAAGKTEIIYILNKPGIFFDGLFNDGIRMEISPLDEIPSIVIDPHLCKALARFGNKEYSRILYEAQDLLPRAAAQGKDPEIWGS